MVATEERWIGIRMYGQYYRETSEGADIHKTWTWLQKSDIKPETDGGSYLCRTRTGIETN
uniref:Uncharacterized protein n=1 Tax=Amphimedon queenslandica TaxID=400682 RepID=A0A1X7STB7_AMPQE